MHDVLIAGGGPVGASLALHLADSGLDVAVVSSSPRKEEALRPVALSHASRLLLERIDAFDASACAPIHSVHVSQQGGFGRTLIQREELGVPALGYVFDLGQLSEGLSARLGKSRVDGRVLQWDADESGVRVDVHQNDQAITLEARLLIVADGGQWAGDDLAIRDYEQSAVVATVQSKEAPAGRAWERFCDTGPLALLPYADRYAAVWTTTHRQAETLAAMEEKAFLRALQQAFGSRLGPFLEAGPRLKFPLILKYRKNPIAGLRTLIIGNAAQSLHPVAGQGLNLGLRDVFELAEQIRMVPRDRIGDGLFLQAYAERRHIDRRATITATDSLVQLFSGDALGLSHARGLALTALDLFTPIRRVFARRMVYGLRNFP
ncbi:MAG TPA: FAD-dependent monooxygenase [Burkholderiales bacterium]|nr:FAD-dependent monooxygenase [Burkholderiales bacterium]